MLYDEKALESLRESDAAEILSCWSTFCSATEALLAGVGDLSAGYDLIPAVAFLQRHHLGRILQDHFLHALEEAFKVNTIQKFWRQFDAFHDASIFGADNFHDLGGWSQDVLIKPLEEICLEKDYQEKCLKILAHAFEPLVESPMNGKENIEVHETVLLSRYQLMVSSLLLATLPEHFPDVLRMYFKARLEEISKDMSGNFGAAFHIQADEYKRQSSKLSTLDGMDIDENFHKSAISVNTIAVKTIGEVVRDLRSLGFASMTEDAYASAIFFLLKNKVQNLAGDDYRSPVLCSIKHWIQAVPLQFLHALLAYLGDSIEYDNASSGLKSPLASYPYRYPGIKNTSEILVRWQLRLEYIAYETLQDLRIEKLFEIIVDYPESSPAIDDLKQCLDYTGQHSKLVDSFISSLRYRLLTAGASTNDILHQYVSTIKALRTIDSTGVFLEAVGEPIRDYLKGRKDTIKCIVTMLTDGSGVNTNTTGNASDSLLEELNRDAESQEGVDLDDEINNDDKQAWTNAERWEPDPVEADTLKGSRNRKIDILGMVVNIIGSKDQLVNEYRIMLAERLLGKSDYEIDSEIRTLELLKIHFGENSMQKCEIMINDLIHSKRSNSNIKATISQKSLLGSDCGECLSLENINATIISSNFWPPIQEDSLNIPSHVDQLLSDYAKRFHEIKTPRKLLWKKNLGTVKLELQFEGRNLQFNVAPVHAAIIMQFQDQTCWTSKNLSAAVGLPLDVLNRRISFWISKGILAESAGPDSNNHVFTAVDVMDANGNESSSGRYEESLVPDDEGDRSLVSIEELLRKEMTIYEKFIIGMLTNFGSMTVDRIHNTLKMFCIAEPAYDKTLQQLQSFLSGLISEEKLEIKDGSYFLKK